MPRDGSGVVQPCQDHQQSGSEGSCGFSFWALRGGEVRDEGAVRCRAFETGLSLQCGCRGARVRDGNQGSSDRNQEKGMSLTWRGARICSPSGCTSDTREGCGRSWSHARTASREHEARPRHRVNITACDSRFSWAKRRACDSSPTGSHVPRFSLKHRANPDNSSRLGAPPSTQPPH